MCLKLITNKEELEGTAYFELLPGRFNGKFWNNNAVFMSESSFGFMEDVINKHYADYDHYDCSMNIHRDIWMLIITNLQYRKAIIDEAMDPEVLIAACRFLDQYTIGNLRKNWDNDKQEIQALFESTLSWLQQTLQMHEYIVLMGL
jgi:hypothetical protein